MSRILRRPMFRGGRVDGRGMGITSGLGYEKGGSVQPLLVGQHPDEFKDAEGREQHYTPVLAGLGSMAMRYGIKPGIKYGKKALDYLLKPKGGYGQTITGGKGGTMDKYVNQTLSPMSVKEMLSGLGTSRAGQYFSQSPTLRLLGYGGKKVPSVAKALTSPEGLASLYFGGPYLKDMYDKMFPGEKVGGREFVGEEAEIVGDPRDLPNEKQLTPQQVQMLEMEQAYERLLADTKKKTESDGEETVDIDKAKFAKLLGKDEARGEDISNMLLSFAGKALKPEANVKTAFGEFFEEEAKRPSAQTKVDQAAASLAINKYIKGEISKEEAKTFMKRLELQYSMQTEGKKKSIGEFYLGSDSKTFKGRVKDAVIAAYGQENIVPQFNETTSTIMEEEFEFGPEDIGVIFIETDTKKAYTFNSQGKKVPVLSG